MIWMTYEGWDAWCKFCNDMKYLFMFGKDYESIVYKNN